MFDKINKGNADNDYYCKATSMTNFTLRIFFTNFKKKNFPNITNHSHHSPNLNTRIDTGLS